MTAATLTERYAISDSLRDCLNPEVCAYMEDLDRFLTEKGAMAVALEGITGGSKGNLLSVLRVISNATLGWHKPFERLCRYEFMQSRSAGGTLIAEMSERTVVRCLNALEKAGIIGRFGAAPNGTAVHYALNLPVIFERIRPFFEGLTTNNSKSAVAHGMWERLSSSPILPELGRFICHFFLERAQYGLKKVRELMDSARELMSGLCATAVAFAQAKALGDTGEKLQAKADEPFFVPDKKNKDDASALKPNPEAALAYWDKEVRDTEQYRSYLPNRTKNARGKMANWLEECRKGGLTEEQIRENIREYVQRWYYVKSDNRTLYVPTKKGKLWETRMGMNPDFEYFYSVRRVVVGVLMRTSLPGKSISGVTLPKLPANYM